MKLIVPLLLTALGGLTATAQPPVVRSPVPLRSFGVPGGLIPGLGAGSTPAQALGQTQVLLHANQLLREVQALRQECQAIAGNNGQRIVILMSADRSLRAAADFQQVVSRGNNPAALQTSFAQLDQALAQLSDLLQAVSVGYPRVAQALNRVQYVDDRLHAALGQGVPNADAQRQLVARFAQSIDNQSEELRAVIDESNVGGADRTLSRRLRGIALSARQLVAAAQSGAGAPQVRQQGEGIFAAWRAASPSVARIAAVDVRVRLQATRLEATLSDLSATLSGTAVVPGPDFGIVTPSSRVLVVGAGESGGPRVRIYHDINGQSTDFFAYDAEYRGGVRVAVADLDGDGFPDIVTAPGRDMAPLIRVFDGRTLGLLAQFVAYDPPYDLGTFVAAADLTRGGKAIVAVGPGSGGPPHVKLFDLAAGKMIEEIYPYPKELRCGARVALGDLNGDGVPDLVTAPGPGNGPHVRVFDGASGRILAEYNAFDERWRGGVFIATADLTRNGRAELIAGTDAGGVATVRVFDALKGRVLGEVTPFGAAYRGGVRVGAYDVNNDGVLDIIAAPGVGSRGVPTRTFDGRTSRPLAEFLPFEAGFEGGAFVSGK